MLVDTLFDGPLDVVGDVHGEYDALVGLLELLGYSDDGVHDHGRRLVFLGDLVDRGHDSPAVLEMVMRLVDDGLAQCVLGNHELSILSGRFGHGNGWILDPPPGVGPERYDSIRAPSSRREAYLGFLAGLPVVLENDIARVVHACWHDRSVDALRSADVEGRGTIAGLSRHYDDEIDRELALDEAVGAALGSERLAFDEHAGADDLEPVPVPAHAIAELARQHDNPLRVLTAGLGRPTTLPYFGAGKWRTTERIPWWNTYRDELPVVIGHFWRAVSSNPSERYGVFGQDVLAGVATHEWMGLRRNVYCVDYSVGKRFLSRTHDVANDGMLAAIRVPEWHVVHDDGTVVELGPPGPRHR